jgi:hypothetical protein
VTIFDYLGDILVKKKGDLPLEEYVPFMINRWLSFSSSQAANAINQTVNSLNNLDKNVHYKLLISAFPKFNRMPRIDYIKKIKLEKEEKDNKVELLASNMELSRREIKQLLEQKEAVTL